MTIGTVVIGVLLTGAGALLATVVREKLGRKAVDVQYMRTSSLKDLRGMFDEMSASGLGGSLRQYVELQGAAHAAKPPRTPYTDREVAYYDAELHQIYETEETYTDQKGNRQHRIVRHEDTVSNEKSVEPLLVKDAATGAFAAVDLASGGVQLDLMEGCDRFEPAENMQSFSFFSAFSPQALGSRTLGYRMIERIIPLGQPLYLLGEASLRGSDVVVGRPGDPKKSFIVSTKSEAQIAGEAKAGSTWSLVGGIALGAVGVLIMIGGFLS